MIELRQLRGTRKLFAWVQHVRLDSIKDDRWVTEDVALAMNKDAPIYGRFHEHVGPIVDIGYLIYQASHVAIVKIFNSSEDYKTGQESISTGVSVCDYRDQWSRESGRNRAMRRALGRLRLDLIDPIGIVKYFIEQE